jgi:hypothetical protein
MANTVIAVRSSGTAAATPSLGVIANGEIALNFADGIIYYKTSMKIGRISAGLLILSYIFYITYMFIMVEVV